MLGDSHNPQAYNVFLVTKIIIWLIKNVIKFSSEILIFIKV